MYATKLFPGKTEASKGWKTGLSALMGLMAVAALAILLGGPFIGPSRTVYAAPARANEPWLKIKCVETLVEEGEDFRICQASFLLRQRDRPL